MTGDPWPPVGALCTAADRHAGNGWLHGRCTAHACACPCHRDDPPPAPRVMRSVTAPITCLSCGGPLRWLTGSVVHPTRQAVIGVCHDCGAEVQVIVSAAAAKAGTTPAKAAALGRARQAARVRRRALAGDDLATARAMRDAGASERVIAARFGVSDSTVHRLVPATRLAQS